LTNSWSAEIWRLVLIQVAALIIGLLIGWPLLLLWLATLGYLIWHLRALLKLLRWLRDSKSYRPPESFGVWAEIHYLFFRAQQRQRKRKRLLMNYLHRFQELTRAMPDATVVLRNGGEIDWCNEAAMQLLGLRMPQDRHQRIDNLIRHPAFSQYLARGRYQEPLELPAPQSKETMLTLSLVPYGEDMRLLVARDNTRLYRLEQTRQDFVANVSHELRTPLTVINGYLETMNDMGERDPLRKRWGHPLRVMQEQSVRMTRIVEDLLLLSRLETGRNEVHSELLDVPAMIKIVSDEARALSGPAAHQIELELDRELWMKGNQSQLFSVFSNLVFNAVRYTPAGGRIVIRWWRDGQGGYFEVEDTGVGISPQHVPRLTERFYRVDVGRSRETGGTGLGLAIVKHILERHDARMSIESVVGKGSVFRCHFPPRALLQKD